MPPIVSSSEGYQITATRTAVFTASQLGDVEALGEKLNMGVSQALAALKSIHFFDEEGLVYHDTVVTLDPVSIDTSIDIVTP